MVHLDQPFDMFYVLGQTSSSLNMLQSPGILFDGTA